ncbi:MAG TPA: glycoside hydrolase family 2 protein [Candidatus Eisenbergiella pullicola]|nr:glycoside hydrolase family 2 protein [Candidatus Eisenbergiella pullicola]
MIAIELHDGWKMRMIGTADYIPAKVPGSVYHDLLRHGKMEDPFYRDNEGKALEIMENDFEYVTVFDVPERLLACEKVLLHFDGLDTVADIDLNGKRIAHVENMHRTWEFSVKEDLKGSGNELRILFHSPVRYIKEANEREPIPGTKHAMAGFNYLRKAHCMFGWDWGPRLPDAGIWREVRLIGFDMARIDSVYIEQKHEEGVVMLRLSADVNVVSQGTARRILPEEEELTGLRLAVTVTDPDEREYRYGHAMALQGIRIERPQLWWPNGYGSQPLYGIRVELLCGETVLDSWEKRIGLRTMTVCVEKDSYGETFCHMVNGVKIFAMGADYIPEDSILPRVTPERTRHLLEQARNANHNCIRVWGGGNYPYEAFWDACDELGLIVWMDFMFACAVYDLTEVFEANIRAEFIDNIKRIRHHASLGLWCGNNEMELLILQGPQWTNKPRQKSDYVKMYEYIIPHVIKEYDPNTFYWPASPSSGGAFDDPNDENRGDVHYWDVWHGNKPFTEYRKFYFRYVSEFGFQSFPSVKTCETFTLPEDRNIFSYVMEKHQRNYAANGKIMGYMEQMFLYPSSFDTIIYASQILQMEAIRYGVEHFRRNRGRCMGTIVWQLNDCWPVASWSSIDYCGRWKALHYGEKRFFAPILLSCAEEGLLTQDPNPNAEPYEVKKSIHLNVANESREDVTVTVKWALRDERAKVLRGGETELKVPALSSVWLGKEELPDADFRHHYVSYDCYRDGRQISGGTVLFAALKLFAFIDPKLTVRVEGDELRIGASAFAKSVEIANDADDLLLSDNYFDMNAGEKRVKLLSGRPEGLKLRSVFDIR